MRRRLPFVAAILLSTGSALAVPFDNTASTTPAVVSVPGDYASLAQASAAFSGVVGGINRPFVVEIADNLTEAADSYFGNSFGADGSLTIRPAATKTPTVEFTTLAGPTGGVFGHLVLGYGSTAAPTSANHFATTGKYIIDGSNSGGTDRSLTLKVGAIADGHNRVVRIFGETNGVIIRNTSIINDDTNGSGACIGIGVANVPGVTTNGNAMADNVTVQNCALTSLGSTTGRGIEVGSTGLGTMATGEAVTGLVVRDNDFLVRQQAVISNFNAGHQIFGNRVTLGTVAAPASGNSSVQAGLVAHGSNNAATGYTVEIHNNVIEAGVLAGGTTNLGMRAFWVTGLTPASSPTSICTVRVYNNIVKAFTVQNTTATTIRANVFDAAEPDATYVIEHNTIDYSENAGQGAYDNGNAFYAAVFNATTLTSSGGLTVRNNLVRYAETSGRVFDVSSATNLTIAGNAIATPTAPAQGIGAVAGTTYSTFADWQTAGYDTAASGGQTTDPSAIATPWGTDLRFASTVVGLGAVATSTITTDIEGEARPAAGAIPGADSEAIGTQTEAGAWNLYM